MAKSFKQKLLYLTRMNTGGKVTLKTISIPSGEKACYQEEVFNNHQYTAMLLQDVIKHS